MKCADLERLLPQYLDESLTASDRRSVEAHLQNCADCRHELSAHRLALASLERVSLAPAPDLWQAFSQRMAAEITCREVREWLPAYHDGALGASRSVSVHHHLQACVECAVEAEQLAASLDTLERVGEASEVDLWAAFVERREAEAKRPAGVFARLAAAFRTAWSSPGFQPALGLGVAALFLISGRQVILATHPESRHNVALEKPSELSTHVSVPRSIAKPAGVAAAPPERKPALQRKPVADRPARIAAQIARPGFRRPQRVARNEVPVTPVHRTPAVRPAPKPAVERLVAAVEEPAARLWTRQLQVSYNMPEGAATPSALTADRSPAPAGPVPAPKEGQLFKNAVVVNSGRAQAEVMPEVVEAVRLLAGIEDASRNPFRTERDGH